MNTKSKNKIYIILLAAVLALTAVFLSVIFAASAYDVQAAGNVAYPPDGNWDIESFVLDVNGADASSESETQVSGGGNGTHSIESGNMGNYRKRQVTVGAIMEAYKSNSANSEFPSDMLNYISTSNYALYRVGETGAVQDIFNSFTEYVRVTKEQTGSGVYALTFEGLKSKSEKKPFIAITFHKTNTTLSTLPKTFTVYMTITVNSTFVPATLPTHSNSTEYFLRDDIDDKSAHFELGNGESKEFYLSDFIGQKLYYRDGTSNKKSDFKPLVENIDTSKDWVLNDISSFAVTSSGVEAVLSSDMVTMAGSAADGMTTPIATVTAQFTETSIESTSWTDIDGNKSDFWNAAHYLKFRLTNTAGNVTVTLAKRIYFTPTGLPNIKKTYTMPVSLNASSGFQFADENRYLKKGNFESRPSTFEDKDENNITAIGVSQVRVKPSFLCDYPTSGFIKLQYNEQVVPSSDCVTVEVVYKKDDNGDNILSEIDYYMVTASKTGHATVNFPLMYGTSGTTGPIMYVPVSFNVYGQYSMDVYELTGKKNKVISTVNSDIFKPFVQDGFSLIDAQIRDESSKSLLQVSRNKNEISLTPFEQGQAVVVLTFMNMKGEQISIDWAVNINPKGGSILDINNWPLHYIILFYIGVGLLVLAIILLLVWLFIRAISKRKQEENQTTAPTSAYIIKLNSQIAAAQAQQRAAATQTVTNTTTQQTQMLALGAGAAATGAAPASDNTLALGAGTASNATPPPMTSSFASEAAQSEETSSNQPKDDIYIPLSDDELLERIFIEKYEPRGMARRSFFKSKDLQSRELEKEKARIRDDVRDGMTIEEACKSLSERQNAQNGASVISDEPVAAQQPEQEVGIIALLGFDPASPLVDEPLPTVEADPDALPEETALKNIENKLARIEKELGVIESRLEKTQKEIADYSATVESSESTLQMKEDSNASLRKSIEDLEFKLATAKSKDKEKLLKDIENKEHVITSNKEFIVKLQEELTQKRGTLDELNGVLSDYNGKKQTAQAQFDDVTAQCEQAKEDCRLARELMDKARKAQETQEKLGRLRPMLESVNTLDAEIREMTNRVEKESKEKDTFKAEVSDLQKQMLGTTDVSLVNELSSKMSELNKNVSDLDKSIAATNKAKADKTIEFNGERRKANEFIDKEELEAEDVVREEDDVIGKMAFEEYVKKAQEDRVSAEETLARLQAEYDELVGGYDTEVMNMAVKASAEIKEAEDAVDEAQAELDILNEKMETASDDDKLMMSIDQMSLSEKLEKATNALGELQAAAAKEKVEYQMQYDAKLEETKNQIEEAQNAYDAASKKVDESVNKINPLDLILSGSGVISQDRKRMEAENLKKQLELSKSAMEQAKLQAKMAQMDAERAIVDAQRASDESKAEAERAAQEAISKAEEARLAAEQKSEEDAEKARQEIERAKLEAEEELRRAAEELERARKEAEEETERVKREAEEARLAAEQKAAEEAEQAKKAAEEEAERIRKEAEEQVERAKREAEEARLAAEQKAAEEAEQAKKAAEEEAERIRKEAEEEKRRAEEEAERDKAAKEQEENRIKEKIEKKKAHILEMRKDLRTVTDEASAKDLKEKFYNELVKLDDDEKSTPELKDLINKSMDDADHAAEVSMYKTLANKAPKRVVKKVTERINKIPKKKARPARPGARPGARPARPGARPGARSARPGARPARPGARPGARPTRPGSRPPRPRQ